jgi:hypothetical protein
MTTVDAALALVETKVTVAGSGIREAMPKQHGADGMSALPDSAGGGMMMMIAADRDRVATTKAMADGLAIRADMPKQRVAVGRPAIVTRAAVHDFGEESLLPGSVSRGQLVEVAAVMPRRSR